MTDWLEGEAARCACNLERCPHCGHKRYICEDDYDDDLDGDNETPCEAEEE